MNCACCGKTTDNLVAIRTLDGVFCSMDCIVKYRAPPICHQCKNPITDSAVVDAVGGAIMCSTNCRDVYEKQIDDLKRLSPSLREFSGHLSYVMSDIQAMLLAKNRKYGNSAIEPKRIFSRADPIEQINVRIDDKLSHIASCQPDDTEDIELDLIGYLILKRIAKRYQETE